MDIINDSWIKKTKELGITTRYLNVGDTEIIILYIQQITDRNMLSLNIIKPLLLCQKKAISIDKIINTIYIDDFYTDTKEKEIINYVL
ncbi:hypothetical protein, partial [Vallitalea guaymasensis]|uniref:hypothetical protein n=1 Tax=Vallitalea guaymasensis TaxID=1185412 RepID=UPI002F41C706